MSQNGGESIIGKITSALATLRRERDDLHRAKELAVERHRLARADREAVEKTIQGMKENLRKFQQSTTDCRRELGVMEQEVDQLSREAKFQHSELVIKKEKLSRLDSKRKDEAKTRGLSMSASREALRKRRDASSKNGAAKSLASRSTPVEEKQRKLQMLTEVDGGEELFLALPDLINKRVVEVKEETGDVEQVCAALRRRIAGYQKSLGGSMQFGSMEDDGALMMQQ